MMIPYEGQEADPILQGFRRSALSMLAPKSTTPCGTPPQSTTPCGTSPKSTTPYGTPPQSTTPSGTPPPTSVSDPVRQRILQSFTRATIYPTGLPSFVPINTLTELINIQTISTALAEAGRHDLSFSKCAKIARTLPRVFATLLLIENVQAISDFESQELTDRILPLLRPDAPPKGREVDFVAWHSTIHTFSDEPFGSVHPVSKCFRDPSLWTLDKFKHFYNSQWLFSAPVFESKKFEYILAPQSPLPFSTRNPHQAGGVHRSQVYMASIHPAHLSRQNTVRGFLVTIVHRDFTNINRLASWEPSFPKSLSKSSRPRRP